MSQTAAQLMKAAINADLQTLVNTGVLKGLVEADYSKTSVFNFTWPGFPSAVVLAPTISKSEYEDTFFVGFKRPDYPSFLSVAINRSFGLCSDFGFGVIAGVVSGPPVAVDWNAKARRKCGS